MQPDELRRIGEAVFGKFWQTALAREIGVADRTVRRWLAGNARGWTCCVEQGKYGHYARKPTLLLVYGLPKEALPELEWGHTKATYPQWAIDKYGIEKCKRAGEMAFKGGGKDSNARISTPIPFRDLLISIARRVYEHR